MNGHMERVTDERFGSAVKVSKLVKRYGDMLALDYFDLDVREGEIFGLLGPNGSGKTTAINCILALLTFDEGTVRVFGEPIGPTSYALKRRIGIVPQNVAVFNELTVEENIDYFCSIVCSRQGSSPCDGCGCAGFRGLARLPQVPSVETVGRFASPIEHRMRCGA